MSDIEILSRNDIDAMASLLGHAFSDDVMYRYIFKTPQSRQRWLKKIFIAMARIAVGYGQATGIRADQGELVGIALWFPPNRRFPPPFYRTLAPSLPILPLVFEFPAYYRYYQFYQLGMAILPQRERFLYLAGLAVRSDHRRKQLGTRLVQWGQHWAANVQCRLILNCWSPMLPYYERLGFVPFAKGVLRGLDDAYHTLAWEW